MLRKKVRAFATDKKYRPCIKVLTRLLHVVGLLWIISFPYMARNVFTSENALKGDALMTFFDKEGSANLVF